MRMNFVVKKYFCWTVLFTMSCIVVFLTGCIQTAEQEPSALFSPLEPNIISETTPYTFQGEIARGQQFEEQLPSGLVFQLIPEQFDEAGGTGWRIQIFSAENLEQDYTRYANPPFRGTNMLQILGWHFRNADNTDANDGSVNAPQRQRDFNFYLNEADFVAAKELVQCIMLSSPCDGVEQTDSRNDLYANIPRATGVLKITDIALGNLVADEQAWIEWMTFEVTVHFPVDD